MFFSVGPSQSSNQPTSFGASSSEDAGAIDLLSMGLDSLLTGPTNAAGPGSLGSTGAAASSGLDDLLGGGGGLLGGPSSLGSTGMIHVLHVRCA